MFLNPPRNSDGRSGPDEQNLKATRTFESVPAGTEQRPVERGEPPMPMVIPGQPDQLAQEIGQESVEGRPGDPKSGPGMLRAQVGVLAVVVLALAAVIGWWIGIAAGVAALAIGLVGLVFNPVVGAAIARTKEREVVERRHVPAQNAEQGRHA